jgi:hypothetical protein
VQNDTSETRPTWVPHMESINDPFAAIGGYPLEGSGFEKEVTDAQFGESVDSPEAGV